MLLNVHLNKPHDQNVHVLQVMFWIEGKGNWRENSKDLNYKFTKAKKKIKKVKIPFICVGLKMLCIFFLIDR